MKTVKQNKEYIDESNKSQHCWWQTRKSNSGSDSAPVAATAAAETAESLAIRQKISEYAKQIQSLKSEGKGKVGWIPDWHQQQTHANFVLLLHTGCLHASCAKNAGT